jgi:two-component sensor histidine kinase
LPDILINEKPLVSIDLVAQDFSRASIAQLPGIVYVLDPEGHVNLIGKAGLLHLSVEDDGIGFDAQAVSESSLGLHLMRERTTQFGGTFSVDSSAGRGTHILAEIRLPSSN